MENKMLDNVKELCHEVRLLIKNGELEESKRIVCHAMMVYPNNPEPHNLLGIVLAQNGERMLAMNHFRAAWALDQTYKPAIENLSIIGDSKNFNDYLFDDGDLKEEKDGDITIKYDEYGVGHVVRRRVKR